MGNHEACGNENIMRLSLLGPIVYNPPPGRPPGLVMVMAGKGVSLNGKGPDDAMTPWRSYFLLMNMFL